MKNRNKTMDRIVVRQNGDQLYRLGSRQTFATTSVYKGEVKLHIRRYLAPDGCNRVDYTPTPTGIALSPDEVKDLRKHWDTLEHRVEIQMKQLQNCLPQQQQQQQQQPQQRHVRSRRDEEEEDDDLWENPRMCMTPVNAGDYTAVHESPMKNKLGVKREYADLRGLRKELFDKDGPCSSGTEKKKSRKKRKKVNWSDDDDDDHVEEGEEEGENKENKNGRGGVGDGHKPRRRGGVIGADSPSTSSVSGGGGRKGAVSNRRLRDQNPVAGQEADISVDAAVGATSQTCVSSSGATINLPVKKRKKYIDVETGREEQELEDLEPYTQPWD